MNVKAEFRVIDEKLATIRFEGKDYESQGAYVDPIVCNAYLGEKGQLITWQGEVIGTYVVKGRWPNKAGEPMFQIEAEVNGIKYTGRSAGHGMLFKGRRKAGQPLLQSKRSH